MTLLKYIKKVRDQTLENKVSDKGPHNFLFKVDFEFKMGNGDDNII